MAARPNNIMIDKESCSKGGKVLSPEKLAALAEARKKRKIARTPIAPPAGWPSWEALRVNTTEYCRRNGGANNHSPLRELAAYIGVDESSVRRWLRGAKIPRQKTVDKIGNWRRVKEAGL